MEDVIKVLKERGFLAFTDDESFFDELAKRSYTVYIGYDPTGPSLQVGNLLTLMGLAHFQRAGHKPITLIGGGTALIGDPSGKSKERVLLTREKVKENGDKIKEQFGKVLDFDCGENSAIMEDNYNWIGKLSLVEFLRDVGKLFRVNEMLTKESVKARIDSEVGISLTEFCYQTLQAHDFLELNRRYNCEIQAGGQDQWGNIAAGIDYTRRNEGKRVHGICFPLIMNADGTKLGKTEEGTVWLDGEMTSPFQFYQFWIRTDDRDVIKYLKLFTFLPIDEIDQLEKALEDQPEAREAHKRLALEVTTLIHGQETAENVKAASEKMYSGRIMELTKEQMDIIFPEVSSSEISADSLSDGISLIELLDESGLCKSKGDAKRMMKSGAVRVNEESEKDMMRTLNKSDCAIGSYIVLRRGKKNYHILRAV